MDSTSVTHSSPHPKCGKKSPFLHRTQENILSHYLTNIIHRQLENPGLRTGAAYGSSGENQYAKSRKWNGQLWA